MKRNVILHKARKKMSAWRYLALGYLLVIAIGSILLVLPFAARDGQHTSYINALFTATSATCVTGLIPFDTATHWSLFGQIVILLLIQLGGLGFTTFVSVIFLMVRHGFGLHERQTMLQSIGSNRLAGIKTLIRRILIGTFATEIVGAGLLCIRFVPQFGVSDGIWYSLFHSVSAYCNAGFDIMGTATGLAGGESLSLTQYMADPLVVLVLSALIIVGGLGFCLWGDVLDCKLNPKKFQFYTKAILTVNAILLVVPTLLYLLFERANPILSGTNFGERLLACVFASVTTRTAGFFTLDPATLSESGYLLTVVLMFIGGSSGSTAGGIKVGTFTVLFLGMVAVLSGKRDITVGSRRISSAMLGQALAIFITYLTLILSATILICTIQPELLFRDVLFEAVSALGTVGLGMGGPYGIFSQIVLILLMYMGRVGVLTLAFALKRSRESAEVRKPVADPFYIG